MHIFLVQGYAFMSIDIELYKMIILSIYNVIRIISRKEMIKMAENTAVKEREVPVEQK